MTGEPSRSRDRVAAHLLDALPGIAWVASGPGAAFSYVSAGAEHILGFPLERWSQPGFLRDRLHADDREWVLAAQQRALSGREGYTCEYRVLAADDRVVWFRDTVTVIVENGEVKGLRGL